MRETQEECVLPGSKENGWELHRRELLRLFCTGVVDRTNDDNKYRILVEKLIKLEANDWPKFQEHLKNLLSVEFYQAPAQQHVGRDPILESKQKHT